jgi:predicted methyltransferase
MKDLSTVALLLTAALLSCSARVTPAPAPPPLMPPVAVDPAPILVERSSTPEEAQAAPGTSDEQNKLAADFKKLRAGHEAELARLTPGIRNAAAKLAMGPHATLHAGVKKTLAGPHRHPGNAARDTERHPLETLELCGVRPKQSVLEYGPGEGWYTEILAPLLARDGKLFITSGDPEGPKDQRSTYYAHRTKLFLEALPEAYGKVETLVVDTKAPKLPLEGSLDTVLLFRGIHGMQNRGVLGAWLSELYRALKPAGLLCVEQHRAPPDADPVVSSKQGYVPEPFVIEQAELAGFELVLKSDVNANPKDTKDHPEGVWTLPPTLRLGDQDREKYLAIGESDRMTLKFVKVEKPAAKK